MHQRSPGRPDRCERRHEDAWQAASSTTGSPVVGGGYVWALDPAAGVLAALDPRTGHATYSVSVGVTSRFATPAISGADLIVPTQRGVTVVTTG